MIGVDLQRRSGLVGARDRWFDRQKRPEAVEPVEVSFMGGKNLGPPGAAYHGGGMLADRRNERYYVRR